MYPNPDQPTHPNGMRFTAFNAAGHTLATEVYFSIGGGFIVTAEHFSHSENATPQTTRTVPYPFRSAAQLLQLAAQHELTIAQIVFANELAMRDDPKIPRPPTAQTPASAEAEIRDGILALAHVMLHCIDQRHRDRRHPSRWSQRASSRGTPQRTRSKKKAPSIHSHRWTGSPSSPWP